MRLNSIKFLSCLVVVAASLVVCICFYYSAIPFARMNIIRYSTPKQNPKHAELVKVLRRAAMADNTVIITMVNGAWSEMLELFTESLRIGEVTEHLLRHVVVVAMDLRALERCKSVNAGQYCFLQETRGVDFSGDKKFMTEDFLKMMWNRIDFLRLVLDLGYSFIFTDVDVMWMRNPISRFPGDGHLTISCDLYNGNPWDKNNWANTGFLYAKSNAFTIEFYKYWYMARVLYPGLNDQDVFYKIKNNPFVQELGIQINYLDTAYFGGFCQPSRDVRKVCTMHANCCVDVENKLHDLRVLLEDWRMYRNGSLEVGGFKWRVPIKCHP